MAWRILIRAAFATTVALMFAPGPARAQELSVEEVLGLYESACDSIASFELQVRLSSYPSVAGSGDAMHRLSDAERKANPRPFRRTRQVLLGDKFRAELLENQRGPYQPGAAVAVWNGVEERLFNLSNRYGSINPAAMNGGSITGLPYLKLYRAYMTDYSYAQMVRDRMPARPTVTRRGDLIELAAPCQFDKPFTAANRGIRLFLDPARGYLPARVEVDIDTGKGPVLADRLENELAEVRPGLWAPVKSRHTVFDPKPDKFHGQELGYEILELERDRCRFNEDVDPALFTLNFPLGTTVQDNIAKSTFIVGNKSRETYLENLAVEGRLGLEELRKTDPAASPHVTVLANRPLRGMLISLNVALVCLLAAVTAYNRYRKRRAEPLPS